jgi:putative integral membrane protein (TIGR02587 family)
MVREAATQARGWRSPAESLSEYGRGVAGGLIFSLPLLYTAEVWELGAMMPPERLAAGLAATLLLLLGYNRYAGLRRDAAAVEVAIDSVEELGLGLLVGALLLWLIGAIEPAQRPGAALGAVLLEGMLAAIGVSVGTAQLGGGGDGEGGTEGDESSPGVAGLGGQLALGSCGAVLIAANVAPTEEVARIAAAVDAPRLLGLMVLGLALTALICFFSDFVGTQGRERPLGLAMVQEAVVSYGVAVAVAAGLLWFFGYLDGMQPLPAVARTVVLSVPAALGASAGRLLLQGGSP